MELWSIVLIAFGLAMDAFAVSITCGMNAKKRLLWLAFIVGFFFGFFQFLMPVIGWILGISIEHIISLFDHWVAAVLLFYIGGKMIQESFSDDKKKTINPFDFGVLLLLAVATSIDALAVGLSFGLLNVEILFPSVVIGIITFAMSFIGVFIGRKTESLLDKKAELLGGVILIIIGLKILVQHLFF